MSDELKHECAVAMVVLRKPPLATGDFGGTKLSLLLEKQHNRGQDGAGAAILSDHPSPGSPPYQLFKSASDTPLVDVLKALTKRDGSFSHKEHREHKELCELCDLCGKTKERIFLGHLRYATFGKNDVAFCHPFVHESSDLAHTLLLAGNFNLTNTAELFEDYSTHGSFPTSKADGYLITELISKELAKNYGHVEDAECEIAKALGAALANADGAWTLCGMTGDGWAFATRDPHGIRPGFYYVDENVVVVASERPAIQAAFDVPPEAVKELPPGEALVISPKGNVEVYDLNHVEQVEHVDEEDSDLHVPACSTRLKKPLPRPCSFERIYFSRANDADIHRERKALGAALLPQILEAADSPLEDIFFSYIPNSARIAFHGLLEELFKRCILTQSCKGAEHAESDLRLCVKNSPRFGEVIVKDAKFRTFIADAAARREFYKHVYDVTYGLVRPGRDTLVVFDDSIVRGNTMKNAILPMLDRLGPKRIVIASSAPPIRYPDCYGIDMSTLGELVAFRALVNLLDGEHIPRAKRVAEGDALAGVGMGNGERELREALANSHTPSLPHSPNPSLTHSPNPLAALYARFTEEEHCAEIARLLTPPGIKAKVVVVYQTVENLHKCLTPNFAHSPLDSTPTNSTLSILHSQFHLGDWYFTGDYPTPGGYKVLHKAISNYLARNTDRSY